MNTWEQRRDPFSQQTPFPEIAPKRGDCGKDKGTRWHPIPSRKGGAHGAVPVAAQAPTAPLGSVASTLQDTAGQAGPGRAAGQGPSWLTRPRPQPGLLCYAQYDTSTADGYLQNSSQGSSKPPTSVSPRQGRRRQKYEKRTQKGRSLCLGKDRAASKAKTTQQNGINCLLEQTLWMPTIAPYPSFPVFPAAGS